MTLDEYKNKLELKIKEASNNRENVNKLLDEIVKLLNDIANDDLKEVIDSHIKYNHELFLKVFSENRELLVKFKEEVDIAKLEVLKSIKKNISSDFILEKVLLETEAIIEAIRIKRAIMNLYNKELDKLTNIFRKYNILKPANFTSLRSQILDRPNSENQYETSLYKLCEELKGHLYTSKELSDEIKSLMTKVSTLEAKELWGSLNK